MKENDVPYLISLFRDVDSRRERLTGLKRLRDLIEDYYDGAEAGVWYAAVNALISAEYRNPRPIGI